MTSTEPIPVRVPDCPPGCFMAASHGTLTVTVLHATAADFFWRQRRLLTASFSCTFLRLLLLRPQGSGAEPIEMEWSRQQDPAPPNNPPISRS